MRDLVHSLRKSPARAVQVFALLVFLVSLVVLGRLEARGVTHADLELDDGTPATLYLPGRTIEHWLLPNPLPEDRRPPGVVVTHAFGADRLLMSTLARRLAANGYAVLAIDLPGHGTSPHPMPVGRGRTDVLRPTLDGAVAFLADSGYADRERIALVGHSIGAIGVLDFAARKGSVAATVLVSVGVAQPESLRVRNLLLLHAAFDAGWMVKSAERLAARVTGREVVERGTTHGSHAAGTAVRFDRIPWTDHFGVVLSRTTAAGILSWLDASLGVERAAPPRLGDPRWIPFLLAAAAGLVLLVGLGDLLGALAPRWEETPTGGRAAFLLLAAVFAGTLPILATGERLAWFVSLEALDTLLAHLTLIGAILLAVAAIRPGTLAPVPREGRWASLAVAALGAALLYAALAPMSIVLRRLTPTPERLLAFALALPFLAVLFLGLDLLLRRGTPGQAAAWSLAGRALMVVLWIAGVELRIVPPMTVVIGPLFLIVLLPLEVVAWRVHARSRNLVVTAVFESLAFGWIVTMLLPLRL